jgi:hypothetical protein
MSNRWPVSKDIISVYAVTASLIQLWTINVSFEQLPSWASFLNLNEILAVFAYRIAESFVECLLVLCVLLSISFILPPRFFRDVFAVRGTAFVLCSLGSLILFWNRFENDPGPVMAEYTQIWTAGTILLACIITYVSAKIPVISDFLEWISERMVVFLYIFVPISIVSFITILIRNIV